MALLTSELERIKFELGYNLLTLSALPYAIDGITQIFEQVVGPYLQAGELNYSTTAVTAVAPPGLPTQTTLTLVTSPTTILVGDLVVVDQDVAQERAHVSQVTSDTVTVALLKAHSGTYPITVEGGEAIAREMLRECMMVSWAISRSTTRAGIKKADEVEFYASTDQQMGTRDELLALQRHWRDELGTALGVENLRAAKSGGSSGGQLIENY